MPKGIWNEELQFLEALPYPKHCSRNLGDVNEWNKDLYPNEAYTLAEVKDYNKQ